MTIKFAVLAAFSICAAAASPGLAAGKCPAREEVFSSRLPADVMAQISGGPSAAAFPPGAGTLTEPKVANAGVLFHKIRDTKGEAIGVASQMQRVVAGDGGVPLNHTSWTVTIAARGVLFLHQIEDVGPVREAVRRMTADPSLTNVEIQTSIGPRSDKRGVIVGGGGEFEGCTGSFVEVEIIEKVDPANPVVLGLVGVVELRVRFGS